MFHEYLVKKDNSFRSNSMNYNKKTFKWNRFVCKIKTIETTQVPKTIKTTSPKNLLKIYLLKEPTQIDDRLKAW